MECNGDLAGRGIGSARRRRERRLRAALRHEQQTVAMVLSAALHHSAQVGADVLYAAPRIQKTDRTAGWRPGDLKEPEPPWVVEHAVLGDPSVEASDGRTLRFLLTKAVSLQKKEEDEERRKVEEQEKLKTMTEEEEVKELEQARRELVSLLAVPAPRRTAEQELRVRACHSVIHAAHKRKRKKRGRSCPRLSPLVLFLPAQLALGALDIISMPGAWFDSGYIPYVSLGGFGATPCFRQSLARCWVLLRSTRTTGFWETTLCFRISAMLGTTVGTCTASAVSVHAASSSTTVVWLVLLVTMPLGCVPLGWPPHPAQPEPPLSPPSPPSPPLTHTHTPPTHHQAQPGFRVAFGW